MIGKLLSTLGVFAVASACGVLANLWLARALPPASYATYALLFTLFSLTAMVGDAGINQKYLRLFMKAAPGTYPWPAIVRRDARLAAIFAVAALAFAIATYRRVSPGPLALTALASFAFILTQWHVSILRSVTERWWLALLQRGFPIALMAALPLVQAWPPHLAWSAALAFAALNGGMLLAAWLACRRLVAAGSQALPPETARDGGSFLILLVTVSIFFYADRLVVARLCPSSEFASYGLAAALFQVFDLLNATAGFSLASYFAKRRTSSAKLCLYALGILAPLGIACVALVPWVMAKGFGHLATLAPGAAAGLAIAGVFKVLTGMTMSNLNLNASSDAIRRYVLENVAFMGLGLGAMALATLRFGSTGAGLCAGMIWAGRFALALGAERRIGKDLSPVPAG